ncbi:MAG: RluA family pseudouridine synthase [Candidatus Doudnabacteria bacterium]|nr:RluA family pseudouridine synthase [Candidatus Doudnabacteria bacterium]
MSEHSFVVEELKTRLDKYLAKQLPQISRSQIQRDIEGGQAEVNGQPIVESKFVVRLNDKVSYKQSADANRQTELKATNTPLKVLYNNHGLLIIDKPAGLTVHPGAGFKGETLASALLYHFKDIRVVGEDHRPGIVHRLDKDTSGVILVAKTQEMYEFLKDAFAERKIKKEYIALVFGKIEKRHGFIETPIGKSKTDFRKQTAKDPVLAKEAVTEYQVLEYLPTPTTPLASRGPLLEKEGRAAAGVDKYTLILVKLHTGRTHQIRVHLASTGHPLMGDELYGGKRTVLPGLHRQFLHAKKIEVRLPDNSWIEAESELADDLRKVLVDLNSKTVKEV